jgi:hypothetical protein
MRFDPVNSPLDRLFLFWNSYVEEEKLLKDWHESTARVPQPTFNILFDSFLDSWGKGSWDDVRNDMPFDKRSYFQALGVVSHQLIEQIRANVLGGFLVGDVLRRDLSEDDRKDGDRRAQDEIEKILAGFNECVIPSLKNLDKEVEEERDRDNCRGDVYLDALVRMMLIETRCFEIQKHFLATGKVLSEAA